MRLGDLHLLKQNIVDWYDDIGESTNPIDNLERHVLLNVMDYIEETPTADAVEVKCQVGDYVYALWVAPVKPKYIIYCAEVKEIRISMRNCRMTTTYILEPIDYRGRRREYRDEDFGTLVFKKQEDAEKEAKSLRTLYQ